MAVTNQKDAKAKPATEYDVLIVGGGPAGLTAAVYTCRKGLKTGIISIDIGGQTNLTNSIENYPGVDPQPGPQLMMKFWENAKSFGATRVGGKVLKVEKTGEHFTLHMANGDKHTARAVILAYGTSPRTLGVPGEEKFLGRGVSTCTTCDAPLFKKKAVAVVGGGNSAIEGALELIHIGAKKVYLIHRRAEFRADAVTVKKARDNKSIEFVVPSTVEEIKGDKFVTAVTIKDVATGSVKDIPVDGLFIEIGFRADASMVKDAVKINARQEIEVDMHGNTSTPGIFAAGDCTTTPYKQTVISAGDGAKAALECYRWLTGGKGTAIDW